MKIAIGADHRGFLLKEELKKQETIHDKNITWIDVGAFNTKTSDYPDFVQLVCKKVLAKEADEGILLCGTGVGMAIAANRFPGIYAALAWNEHIAKLAKEHDNANVFIIPSDHVSVSEATAMIESWLMATFKGGRYAQRLLLIKGILH